MRDYIMMAFLDERVPKVAQVAQTITQSWRRRARSSTGRSIPALPAIRSGGKLVELRWDRI